MIEEEQISLGGADGKLRAHLRPEEESKCVSYINI